MLTNKERNKVRKYMINRYSLFDEYLKKYFPKLKTKKERAVANMEYDGRSLSSIDNASCGRNLYREGSRLVNSGLGCFHWDDPKVYDLIKKVYGKKKADECVEKGTFQETYAKLIAREYAGMVNDLHSGKDVMLKTTSKTKKSPAKKKTSRWR
jgi:hypothetical protein